MDPVPPISSRAPTIIEAVGPDYMEVQAPQQFFPFDSDVCFPPPGFGPIRSPPRRRSYARRRSTSPPPPVIVVPPMAPLSPPLQAPQPPLTFPVTCSPPPIPWPPSPMPIPVDILTFHHNKNMAYAPAAATYEEAIDTVLELWPELRDSDRDRITLLVGGSDQLVRVPKMAWHIVLCDLPRYEVVHVQVDQPPPPPQYQGDEKGVWEPKDAKKRRSGGFFSSIRKIFWR
ncbi:hypothetical protein F5148DRAFT_727492 [Russula earlei]|uniref:Uncharacterized protein n=1 Tax=Russula earlei TaxID=71964 RepID=A0ACC0TUY5_9AGAM|nr:hypothetical protein F5148DRAFT_727492 [Russula earlei]